MRGARVADRISPNFFNARGGDAHLEQVHKRSVTPSILIPWPRGTGGRGKSLAVKVITIKTVLSLSLSLVKEERKEGGKRGGAILDFTRSESARHNVCIRAGKLPLASKLERRHRPRCRSPSGRVLHSIKLGRNQGWDQPGASAPRHISFVNSLFAPGVTRIIFLPPLSL